MDDYGISQAIATGNNYLNSFSNAVNTIKQQNDVIKNQARRDLSAEGQTEAIESAKDLVSSAYGGYGFGNSAKAWANRGKPKAPPAGQPTTPAEEPTPATPADTPPPQAQPPTEQAPTPPAEQEENTPTEPTPAPEPPEEGGGEQTKFLSKALNITDETAEKLGKFGGIAGGLTQAGMAIAQDVEKGNWDKMNGAEKFGNISNIVGGGAEALGSVLDATGFGAAIGVPLQVFGGLSNLVGGIFSTTGDIVAEGKKKEKLQQQVDNPDVAPPEQQQTALSAGIVPTIVRQQTAY
jgi:cell division septation protein DedD